MAGPGQALAAGLLSRLRELFPAGAVLTEPGDVLPYGYDNSRRQALPQAVVFPRQAEQIRKLVLLCREHHVPLIARGSGTGTTGATVPDQGGIVLSLERMNRILEIDPANRMARVEPGVTNQALQEALAMQGFFWPPDPTSAAVCTIGGNLAYNSAGPRAVKYGTPRDNTLGLSVVTGAGELISTGVRTTKGVVGYDLTRLLIGSEGTLAIITEATLKLTPLPSEKRTLRALYRDMEAAARAVSAIMAQPVTPCALEFLDGESIKLIRNFAEADIPDGTGALLMIETDGSAEQVERDAGTLAEVAKVEGVLAVEVAADEGQRERLWRARKSLSPAQRKAAPRKINEDIAVPVSRMPELLRGVQELSAKHGITIVNFGHAGNGNIHVNLLYDPDDAEQARAAPHCLSEMFDLVLSLDGTLSGEHGVGLEKRDYVARELGAEALALMHGLRRVFDPDDILNPGKALPNDAP